MKKYLSVLLPLLMLCAITNADEVSKVDEVGRYQIVFGEITLPGSTAPTSVMIKLDSKTGETWMYVYIPSTSEGNTAGGRMGWAKIEHADRQPSRPQK